MDEVRPIDANALLRRIRPVSWKDAMNAMLIGDVKILFAKMIEEAPTIEIAPTSANGPWIEVSRVEHDYETEIEEKCSVCGRHVYRYDTQPQDNHCPSCSAKMYGEKTMAEYAANANPYWERITAISERQRAKGIQTYGQGLEANRAAIETRLEYIQEELIDALMYIEWVKDGLKDGEKES